MDEVFKQITLLFQSLRDRAHRELAGVKLVIQLFPGEWRGNLRVLIGPDRINTGQRICVVILAGVDKKFIATMVDADLRGSDVWHHIGH
jgi:hypothetical protein